MLGMLFLWFHQSKQKSDILQEVETQKFFIDNCFVLQDPFYDSEGYRGDGGDGTDHWIYEKVLLLHT